MTKTKRKKVAKHTKKFYVFKYPRHETNPNCLCKSEDYAKIWEEVKPE